MVLFDQLPSWAYKQKRHLVESDFLKLEITEQVHVLLSIKGPLGEALGQREDLCFGTDAMRRSGPKQSDARDLTGVEKGERRKDLLFIISNFKTDLTISLSFFLSSFLAGLRLAVRLVPKYPLL